MEIKRNLMLILASQLYEWRSMAIYRAQFGVQILFSIFSMAITVVFIAVIYQISAGFAGWSFYQLLLLASTASMVNGLLTYIVDIGFINGLFVSGDLDTYLARPFGPAFHLLATGGNRYAVFTVLVSLVVFVYAALNASISPFGIATFLILMLFGLAALAMFCLFLTALSYAALTTAQFVGDLIAYLFGAGGYPLSIYGLIGTVALTVVLPIGLAVYFPAEALFGKIGGPFAAAIFLIEIVVIVLSYFGFDAMLRKYTSAFG